MTETFRGQNGSVVVGGDELEIARPWLAAKVAGFATRRRIVRLSEVTDVTYQRPTMLTNGYVRIAVGGGIARPLSLKEASGHPDAITFHDGQRKDFDKLVSELQRIVAINSNPALKSGVQLSGGQTGALSQIPRTEAELDAVANQRPPHWEYRLFAGLLLAGLGHLEDKWHNHEFRYAKKRIRFDDAQEACNYMSGAAQSLIGITSSIEQLLTPRNTTLAFGPPGIPGDQNRIRILALRLIEIYESFLDWAAEVRSAAVIDELQESFEIAAQLADEPIAKMRMFVEHTAEEIERIIDVDDRNAGEQREFVLVLELTANEGLARDFSISLERAKKRLRI